MNVFKKSKRLGRPGFTLVELVLTLGIFGILMVAGSDFLIQTIRNANSSSIQNEVRQNASAVMLDVAAAVRQSYCVYYFPYASDAVLRLSDDPNADKCLSGNRVEYYQNQFGVVTRAATDSGGAPISFGVLNSANSAILNCSQSGSPCGLTDPTSCAPGLVVTSNGAILSSAIVNGTQVTATISAQQIPGLSRRDFCAAIKLTDSITPRIK